MAEKRGYGIGLQWFPDIIGRECVYIDKTAYVYKLAHAKGKHFFLSRPRRFGKYLLVSTLQAYFEGRSELFRGLAIEQLETEWVQYPVIRLDLSNGKYYEKERVHSIIDSILSDHEKKWNVAVKDEYSYDARMKAVIQAAYEQVGREAKKVISLGWMCN